jgi:hypothetical protein
MRIDTLCRSLCGNEVYSLTITNDLHSFYMSTEEEIEAFRAFEYDRGGNLKTVLREKRVKKQKSTK